MQKEFDVIIVGGGIVGVSLALILAKSLLKVALVEAANVTVPNSRLRSDHTLVLSASSRSIFESIGIWQKISALMSPIQKIHVSDQGHFGSAHILAREEKLSALGYVVSAAVITQSLYAELSKYKTITLFQPGQFISHNYQSGIMQVDLNYQGTNITLSAKLLVAADGHNSSIRKFLNIKVAKKDYQQTAILCNVDLKRPHLETAYERFTEEGPLAFLPLINQGGAVVWTVDKNRAAQLLSLSENSFIKTLQQNFGYRFGQIKRCTSPIGIDLHLITAQQQIAPGVVLLGNSVHTLHPVAGQGLNLALRDLAILAEEIVGAHKKNAPLGDSDILQRYMMRRKKDQQQIITLTHSLVGIFSNSLLPVILARNVSMVLLDRFKWLKRILTKRTSGLAGKVPRLACGMTLEE